MLDLEDSEEEVSWTKKLIGKDILKIPCFESSFICGFTSGSISGLAAFLYSSRANFSFNVGFYTYLFSAIVYWVQCRYKYENNLHASQKLKILLAEERAKKMKQKSESEETKNNE